MKLVFVEIAKKKKNAEIVFKKKSRDNNFKMRNNFYLLNLRRSGGRFIVYELIKSHGPL